VSGAPHPDLPTRNSYVNALRRLLPTEMRHVFVESKSDRENQRVSTRRIPNFCTIFIEHMERLCLLAPLLTELTQPQSSVLWPRWTPLPTAAAMRPVDTSGT